MRKNRLLLLGIISAAVCGEARAETVRVVLKGVLGETAVAAFPLTGEALVRLPAPPPGQSSVIQTLQNNWKCDEAAAGPRLFIFGGKNAATYLTPQQVCAQLKSGGEIAVELAPPTEVVLSVWLKRDGDRYYMQDEVANVNWLSRTSLAGVVYKAKFLSPLAGADFRITPKPGPRTTGPYTIQDDHGHSITLSDTQPSCDSAAKAEGRAMLDQTAINVFAGFLSGINFTCPIRSSSTPQTAPPDRNERVVLLSSAPVLGDLAHELTHASGVVASDGTEGLDYSDGHVPPDSNGTTPPPSFPDGNAMVRLAMILHDRLSLGQVFWMNFSADSWLAQQRRRREGAPENLTCTAGPGACMPYTADLPERERGTQSSLSARARFVRETSCGGGIDTGCPENALTLGAKAQEAAVRVTSLFGANQPEARFNFQFALAHRLASTARYCTRQELFNALGARWDVLCGTARDGASGGKCGSLDRNRFIGFWKQHVFEAILIGASATAITQSQADKWTGDGQAYEKAATATQKMVTDSKLLKKTKGKRILWLDSASGNRVENGLLESLGLVVNCSSSPEDAARQLKEAGTFRGILRGHDAYAAVVTRFGKNPDGGPAVAPRLVSLLRESKIRVPVVIYSKHATPEHRAEAKAAGVLGETDDPLELVGLLVQAISGPRR